MNQHLLIVDDEASIRDLLADYFRKRNYTVSTAATAEDALQLAEELAIHLIILDIALADADGLELLVRLNTKQPDVPVIMLTGMGFDEELLQEALQKGAAGYVSKTLPLDQLLIEVQRALSQAWD
jgi:DNA-binding response OmpR family regulator